MFFGASAQNVNFANICKNSFLRCGKQFFESKNSLFKFLFSLVFANRDGLPWCCIRGANMNRALRLGPYRDIKN